MSEQDPFEKQDTRRLVSGEDRRESLRSNLECKLYVNNDPFEATANVSLTGAFFLGEEVGDGDPPEEGSEIEVELGADRGEDAVRIPARVVAPPGERKGVFLKFPELEFEEERRLARLLDNTADFEENSLNPDQVISPFEKSGEDES